NSYVGEKYRTRFSCARYGNVVGSRGSVIPLFNKQKDTGTITITDKKMTRFWITLEQGVEFVIKMLNKMHGGEVFIPKIPSMRIVDLAEAIAPKCKIKLIGIRPGEKLHECLITENEARHTLEFDDFFVIEPEHPWWGVENWRGGKTLPEDFSYTSEKNTKWLTKAQLHKMLKDI
ncbi:MAG: polysaccharide biosynthesis protein, partial [Candidatus Omnitrophica bacterium]|nr:polysaccharide biosynthesis protein [Candidatus Omnitrophota bacterium]